MEQNKAIDIVQFRRVCVPTKTITKLNYWLYTQNAEKWRRNTSIVFNFTIGCIMYIIKLVRVKSQSSDQPKCRETHQEPKLTV